MYQILSLYNLHHDLVCHTKEKYMIYKIVYNGDLNANGHRCDAHCAAKFVLPLC